jgi:hypothetical protein
MEFTGVSNSSTASAHAWRVAADAAMTTVATVLTDAPFGPAADAIQDYRDTLAAVEALLIAQRKKAEHSDRANEGIIKNSGRVYGWRWLFETVDVPCAKRTTPSVRPVIWCRGTHLRREKPTSTNWLWSVSIATTAYTTTTKHSSSMRR